MLHSELSSKDRALLREALIGKGKKPGKSKKKDERGALRLQADITKACRNNHICGLIGRDLTFWDGKGDLEDGRIYRTDEEWYEKRAITRSQLVTARRILEEKGLLEVSWAIRPRDDRRVRAYKIDLWALASLISPAELARLEPELEHLEPAHEASGEEAESNRLQQTLNPQSRVQDSDTLNCDPNHTEPSRFTCKTQENRGTTESTSERTTEEPPPEGTDAPEETGGETKEELPANAMTRLTVSRTTEVGFDPAPHQKNNWGKGWSKFIYVAEGETPPSPKRQFAVLNEIVSAASGKGGKARYWMSVGDAIERVKDAARDGGRKKVRGDHNPTHQGGLSSDDLAARRWEGYEYLVEDRPRKASSPDETPAIPTDPVEVSLEQEAPSGSETVPEASEIPLDLDNLPPDRLAGREQKRGSMRLQTPGSEENAAALRVHSGEMDARELQELVCRNVTGSGERAALYEPVVRAFLGDLKLREDLEGTPEVAGGRDGQG